MRKWILTGLQSVYLENFKISIKTNSNEDSQKTINQKTKL